MVIIWDVDVPGWVKPLILRIEEKLQMIIGVNNESTYFQNSATCTGC